MLVKDININNTSFYLHDSHNYAQDHHYQAYVVHYTQQTTCLHFLHPTAPTTICVQAFRELACHAIVSKLNITSVPCWWGSGCRRRSDSRRTSAIGSINNNQGVTVVTPYLGWHKNKMAAPMDVLAIIQRQFGDSGVYASPQVYMWAHRCICEATGVYVSPQVYMWAHRCIC